MARIPKMVKRVGSVVIIAMLVVVVFYTVAGWKEQVPDFEQPPTYTYTPASGGGGGGGAAPTPVPAVNKSAGWTIPVIPPPTYPVVWDQVSFEFIISNLGIANSASGTDFYPKLSLDNITMNRALFVGMGTAQIFKSTHLSLSFWTPPHIPSNRQWTVTMVVYSTTSVIGWWNDTVVHTSSFDQFTITGESGRVFVKEPPPHATQTLTVQFMCKDTMNGYVYAAKTQQFTITSSIVAGIGV